MDALALGQILVALVAGGFFVYMITKNQTSKTGDDGSFLLIQQQLSDLSKTVDKNLGDSRKEVQDSLKFQMEGSQRLMRDITRQMNEQLTEVHKGITESTENSKKVFTITEQLRNLEKVLTHQKQRGTLGEQSLELILGNVLPPGIFRMQHAFKDGETVDAVIETKDGVIPIDAKFSLDNYNRLAEEEDEIRRDEFERAFIADLKRRIDETAKYIREREGTLPFALMYIPAEGIYYDLLVNRVGSLKANTRSLIEYAAAEKKVIIVSPTTLLAYLQTVLFGYRSFRIEEAAKEIAKNVGNLGKHLAAYETYHEKLGTSLGAVVNHYNSSRKQFKLIDKDVYKISGESAGIKELLIEKPDQTEE
ncbi:MAG: DNA recombination protein RmuC [Candidatus Vogelbacteria bacterium CG10_big_fil_rev_8_21_14_0_10_45_14]|uniref:DNA recombination protein RmuC n=1 Tax=Candidatus Vogelbacteria bacterium CG10_big_fil_rev_8_21_14_0_10_45_14 TaxID=1975042 RepID=A0A2H0RJD2_9BACT|nr:MAG: DNA recombination protein RmuC [Candidatus Vogelbacteria bacterium CG10_big_fil_rev_8_21_14_0_10_45_14]